MTVEDVMTSEVLTVGAETPLKEVAALLAGHRISGLPVLEAGRVVGVVSEADILSKESGPTEPRHRFRRRRTRSPNLSKARAHTAGTAMTSPAITVAPDDTIGDAARTMIESGVNRLPVLADDCRLIGIVTRADLVRAFARPDAEIEREVREEVALKRLWIDPTKIAVRVDRGEVLLDGTVESDAEAELLVRFARRVPGVVGVLSRLRWQVDHPKLPQGDPRVPQPPRR